MKYGLVVIGFFLLSCTTMRQNEQRGPSSANKISAADLSELYLIPDQLHIRLNSEKIAVKVRKATIDEVKILLRSDESDEASANIKKYWKKNNRAYYRWNVESGGEVGLISDMTKELMQVILSGEIDPDTLPTVVVIPVNGQERVIGFGATYGGDVKFHSDSELRKTGYKGIGTVLIADYLRWCLQNSMDATLEAVNNSYGFYERFGFEYDSQNLTPSAVANPESARFSMRIKFDKIPEALILIKKND